MKRKLDQSDASPFDRFVEHGGRKDMLRLILAFLTDKDVLLGIRRTQLIRMMDTSFKYELKSQIMIGDVKDVTKDLVIRSILIDKGEIEIPSTVTHIDMWNSVQPPVRQSPHPYVHAYPNGLLSYSSGCWEMHGLFPPSLQRLVCHRWLPTICYPNLVYLSVPHYTFDAKLLPSLKELKCSYLISKLPLSTKIVDASYGINSSTIDENHSIEQLTCMLTDLSMIPNGIPNLNIAYYPVANFSKQFNECNKFTNCKTLTLQRQSNVIIKNAPLLESLTLESCCFTKGSVLVENSPRLTYLEGVSCVLHNDTNITVPSTVRTLVYTGLGSHLKLHDDIEHLIVWHLKLGTVKLPKNLKVLEITTLEFGYNWNCDLLPSGLQTVIIGNTRYECGADNYFIELRRACTKPTCFTRRGLRGTERLSRNRRVISR